MHRLPDLDRLPEHRALLERAVAHFRDDARVVGLVAGGSLARGGMDFYSDLDLYVVARDEAFDEVFAGRSVAAEVVGAPLFSFDVDPVPGGSRDYIVVYEGPVKLDFMYYAESELAPAWKWRGCPVLKDGGSVTDVIARSADLGPPRPTPETLLALDQKFWTWCWYAFGKIARGESWEALNAVHVIRSDALVPLLDWLSGAPQEGYRRLEQKLDPQTNARLRATATLPEPGHLYAALRAEIELFRDLRVVLFDRHGIALDPEPEEAIMREMNRRWSRLGS